MQDAQKYREAFESMFKKNYQSLYYCAYDILADSEEAKDVVNGLFSDLWQKRASPEKVGAEGYLFKAVRNRSLNYLKHKAVKDKFYSETARLRAEAVDEDPEEHESHIKLIYNTMAQFSEKTRHVFRQCSFEGRSYREVAEELGVTEAAVHKHISLAMASLREAFGKKSKK
ncbi:MAG: RNA polymerase sigma-70 factor [Bacteroidales bacterium]|nr:RNA polymerase sigma-70 factor [Bacteroidales bacterium]